MLAGRHCNAALPQASLVRLVGRIGDWRARQIVLLAAAGIALLAGDGRRAAADTPLFPPDTAICRDRPRLLLRPEPTPHAISLQQLRSSPLDAEGRQLLEQLKGQDEAAAQALVWLLTGEEAAADKAIRRMQEYRFPGDVDTFHVYFQLTDLALAYDWLHDHPRFPEPIRAAVRARVKPLAEVALRFSDDHVFHNYIWMSAGGCAAWALATVGEDADSDRLYGAIAERFDQRLFPALRYLDGLPSEPLGYWSLYDLTPAVMTVIALQSACQADRVAQVQAEQGDWLNRHFDNLVHSVLPNMRYIPWGDLQSGPNGGITFEMAGLIDAATWALDSPHGAYLSRWLAEKRGPARFHGATAVYYFLYTRHLATEPQEPPRAFLAGGSDAAHWIARSHWADDATIVTLRCTDHYGDHNHYDQGSFIVYRHGLLAVDPPVYQKIRGPQQATENHNTLLIDGQPQRAARGQSFRTLEQFQANLAAGRRLETGELLFHTDRGAWAAASCQFAQAYDSDALSSCVRQILFVRPDKIVVVDQLAAAPGATAPEVDWLLQLPGPVNPEPEGVVGNNGRSWLRLRPLFPAAGQASITKTPVNTHRVQLHYSGREAATLVHLIQVGDGPDAGAAVVASAKNTPETVEVQLEDRVFASSGRLRSRWNRMAIEVRGSVNRTPARNANAGYATFSHFSRWRLELVLPRSRCERCRMAAGCIISTRTWPACRGTSRLSCPANWPPRSCCRHRIPGR